MASGRVRFVFLHLPILGDESIRAAEAAECAGEQQQFWKYHDLLFENGNGENQGAFADTNLLRFVDDMGLDGEAFRTCLASRRFLERIGTHRQLAKSIDVNSTPTVVVNNVIIPGLRDFATYRDAIDRALSTPN